MHPLSSHHLQVLLQAHHPHNNNTEVTRLILLPKVVISPRMLHSLPANNTPVVVVDILNSNPHTDNKIIEDLVHTEDRNMLNHPLNSNTRNHLLNNNTSSLPRSKILADRVAVGS